jgi:hypothetical protein
MFCKHLLCIIGTFFVLKIANAELLTDSNLSFGKIAVTSNADVSTVQISRAGRAFATGNIYIIEIGQPGVYTFTELPPYAAVNLSVTLPIYSTSPIPGNQQFTISAIDMPSTLGVDASGTSEQFKIGGVLQTSGLGGVYIGPSTFDFIIPIDISY